MKKIALCAAIATLCAAPVVASAGADVYGQLRYSINSVDMDDPAAANDGLEAIDNVSLFGLKASTEGDGVKAFIHIQTGAKADGDGGTSTSTDYTITHDGGGTETVTDTDTTDGGRAFVQRFYFGGLSGSFGQVAYGRMTNAYKFAGFAMDPFYNHSHIGVGGKFEGGLGTYGLSPLTNGFTDNALQYTSMDLGGLKVNLSVYIDDSAADEHGSNIGVEYNKDGIKAGVQMASNGKAVTVPNLVADGDAMRIYGGYTAGNMSVSASVEIVDQSATVENTYAFLVGKYKMSDKTRLAATYGTVSGDTGTTAAEGKGITAGVFQTVAPQTEVFLSTSMVSLDATGAKEPSVVSVGAIHKF